MAFLRPAGEGPRSSMDSSTIMARPIQAFLIMNPKLLNRVSTPVKLWIYAHECGHQFRGPDEETADCFAVQRGRRQGWLDAAGLEEVCKFISPSKGDSMHFSGAEPVRIHAQMLRRSDNQVGRVTLFSLRFGCPQASALVRVGCYTDHIMF